MEYCENANIKLQTVYSDARNIKCSFLNHLVEDTMVNMWQKKNPYNGIEITAEKIDKYFSPDYIELSNEEIEVIRSNSKFLSENPGENHMPKEEQYILKMYLLNMKPNEAYKAYCQDGNKKNKITGKEFIHQAAQWIEWKSGIEHSMDRFTIFSYDKRKKLHSETHTLHGIEIISYIINSENIKNSDLENVGPLYLIKNKMTGTKTVILGDMPKDMQKTFYDKLIKDKKLQKKFKNVDCIQISHHGSENNYYKELIEFLNPTLAVIPECLNNEYNEKEQKLPSPVVVRNLKELDIPVLLTGDYGDVAYYKEDGVLHVKPQKVLKSFNDIIKFCTKNGWRNEMSNHLEKFCDEGFVFLDDNESKRKLTKIFSSFTKELEKNNGSLSDVVTKELETIKQIEQKGEKISKNREKGVLDILVKEIKNLNRIFKKSEQRKIQKNEKEEYIKFKDPYRNTEKTKTIGEKLIEEEYKYQELLKIEAKEKIKNPEIENFRSK